MTFVGEDGELDVDAFRYACRLTITAQEILVDNASYPTPKIEENSHRFRPLGLGYANLGALLMSRGLAYDSPAGQAYAGAITSVMTAEAYRQSAVIARDHGGPFIEFEKNRAPFMHVIDMHRDAAQRIPTEGVPAGLGATARSLWDETYELGERHGYRNAQTTLLAPTGCLVGDSLVLTDRGLVRLRGLGNPDGEKWQDLDLQVATDDGPRPATRFFVNGAEPVVTVETSRGYRIQGTTTHRIRVVDADGDWQWRRFADLRASDRVPHDARRDGRRAARSPASAAPRGVLDLGPPHVRAALDEHGPRRAGRLLHGRRIPPRPRPALLRHSGRRRRRGPDR